MAHYFSRGRQKVVDGFNGMTIGVILFYSHASFVASARPRPFLRSFADRRRTRSCKVNILKSVRILPVQFLSAFGLATSEDEVTATFGNVNLLITVRQRQKTAMHDAAIETGLAAAARHV